VACFTLHFKGPLVAFGGPKLDGEPQGLPIPTRSMVTGLIGAALGLSRSHTAELQAIQDSMLVGVVVHAPGVEIIDYQTADLDKRHMRGPMWSADRRLTIREGSTTRELRQQWRPYLADVDMTVLVELRPGAPYGPQAILDALDEPARPLFLGRASCPPEVRIAGRVMDGDLQSGAAQVAAERGGVIYLPLDSIAGRWGDMPISIPGRRDWLADRHAGSDLYVYRGA
jgi:CRISPR system Cascade subunit CasD